MLSLLKHKGVELSDYGNSGIISQTEQELFRQVQPDKI